MKCYKCAEDAKYHVRVEFSTKHPIEHYACEGHREELHNIFLDWGTAYEQSVLKDNGVSAT